MMRDKLYPLLAVALLAVGCSDPSVEIVEQDKSYKIDDNVTKVDIPKKFDHDPSNFVAGSFSNSEEVVLQKRFVGGIGTMLSSEIPVFIRLRRPANQAIKFTLTPDVSLLESYPKEKTGFLTMPEGVLPTLELTIPAGQISVDGVINLSNTSALSEEPGYIGALRLEAVDAPEDIKILDANKNLFIKVGVSSELVTTISELPAQWSMLDPTLFYASSSFQPTGSYWANNDPSLMLDGDLNETNRWLIRLDVGQNYTIDFTYYGGDDQIVGMAIHYLKQNWSRNLSKVTILVADAEEDEDNLTWDNYGSITWTDTTPNGVYLKFNRPIPANRIIRLVNLETPGNGMDYVGFREVQFFTE